MNKTRNFKGRWILFAVLLLVLVNSCSTYALKNPMAVYCEALNYTYNVSNGNCIISKNLSVPAYKFLSGEVAQKYSYCELHGYKIKHIDNISLCIKENLTACSVCVLPNGSSEDIFAIMNLSAKEGYCGDGICDIGETYDNCPQDCYAKNVEVTVNSSSNTSQNNETTVFSSTCGDNVCESYENYKICSKDCPSGSLDSYCDKVRDGRCDPDCRNGQDPDCPNFVEAPPKNNENSSIRILFVVSLLLVIVVFIVIIKNLLKKGNKRVIEDRMNQIRSNQSPSNQTFEKDNPEQGVFDKDPFEKYKGEL